ncbi:MAG: HEPN domain-containing protein [Candidatus Binatia bacterium]
MARSFLRRAAAVLRAAGAEIPEVHDVSGALRRHVDRLPAAVAAEIDTLVSASRRLREERKLAFYGDEESDTEAESLFSLADADEALRQARHVLAPCTRSVPAPSA